MNDQYVSLIASLPPHLPSLFATRQPPISRIKLDERLNVLESADRSDLAVIENLVHWDRMAIDTTDDEMLEREKLAEAQLKNTFIKEIVRWRLEMRTFVSALRHRQLGITLSYQKAKWGYGRWVQFIENHWNEAAFGLGRQFPWLPEAETFLMDENNLGLERLLLSQIWDYYGRAVGSHYFDFEAVVVYVLRWDVIDRWSRYDSSKAEKRFREMADQALGEHIAMFS